MCLTFFSLFTSCIKTGLTNNSKSQLFSAHSTNSVSIFTFLSSEIVVFVFVYFLTNHAIPGQEAMVLVPRSHICALLVTSYNCTDVRNFSMALQSNFTRLYSHIYHKKNSYYYVKIRTVSNHC